MTFRKARRTPIAMLMISVRLESGFADAWRLASTMSGIAFQLHEWDIHAVSAEGDGGEGRDHWSQKCSAHAGASRVAAGT